MSKKYWQDMKILLNKF